MQNQVVVFVVGAEWGGVCTAAGNQGHFLLVVVAAVVVVVEVVRVSDDIIKTGSGWFGSLLVSSTGASNRTGLTQLDEGNGKKQTKRMKRHRNETLGMLHTGQKMWVKGDSNGKELEEKAMRESG